jgi:hypothetical protein
MSSVAYKQTDIKHDHGYFSKLDALIKELDDANSNVVFPSDGRKTQLEMIREKNSTNLRRLQELRRAESVARRFSLEKGRNVEAE